MELKWNLVNRVFRLLIAPPVNIYYFQFSDFVLECYNIDVTPCGTGLVYGGNGLGSMDIKEES